MTTTPAMPELPDSATVLPDGSAFAIASFPLPSDHWLYAPREYRDGEEEPIELPSPILSHQAHGDVVRAAIRYAVRSATMCGKEPDFDPDALVRNAMYALCGPFGGATLQAQPAAEVSDAKWDGAEEWMPLAWELCAEEHGEEACNELIWTGGPIPEPWGDRWLQYEDEAKRLIALVRKHVPALRPQAVPMTEQWRLLRSGERIEAGDEGLQDDCVTWLPLAGWEVGMTYNPTALVPMRRRVPSITAPAGGEGQA